MWTCVRVIVLMSCSRYITNKQTTFPVQPTLAAITAGLGVTLMNNKAVPNPFNATLNQLWAVPCGRVIVLWEEEGRYEAIDRFA